MKRLKYILPILLLSCLANTHAKAQESSTKANIENTQIDLIHDTVIRVTFDILYAKPEEIFYVTIELYRADGVKLPAKALTGDVNKAIRAGFNKEIYWNVKLDMKALNDEIYAVVTAKPGHAPLRDEPVTPPDIDIDKDTTTTQKDPDGKDGPSIRFNKKIYYALGYSAICPGWGNYYMTDNYYYFGIGAAAWGSLAYSYLSRESSKSNYQGYLDSEETSERNSLYKSAESNKLMHNIFLYTAIGIWGLDAIFTAYQWFDAYNEWKAVRYTSFNLNLIPDPYTNGARLSITYRF